MDYVIDEVTARSLLDEMIEEYGTGPAPEQEQVLIHSIRLGLLDFDATTGKTSYTLQKPVELKNGENFSQINLEEPTQDQIERINRGLTVTADSKGIVTMDSSTTARQIARMVAVIGGVPTDIVSRIKRRDYQVLEGLTSFFL